MINYVEGNLLYSDAQTLVCTVNTVGVMGAGIALAMAKRWPLLLPAYRQACLNKDVAIDKLWSFEIQMLKDAPRFILCFPTKEHWIIPSEVKWIEDNLARFVREYKDMGITSIAFPKLGCKNGKLEWEDVKPLMEKYLSQVDIPVTIYI